MTKEKRLQAHQRQIRRLQRRLVQLERTSYTYSWVRLAIFTAGMIASGAFLFLEGSWLAWSTFFTTLLVFGLVVARHRRLETSIARHKVWLEMKATQIARMRLDWGHIPPSSLAPDHPLALDLDLLGDHSLHRLLNTAVSRPGGERLGEWLVNPLTGHQQIEARQQLVRELVPLSLFRQRLALAATLAGRSGRRQEPERLLAWLQERPFPRSLRYWLVVFSALAAANLLFFLADLAGLSPSLWKASLLLYLGLFLVKNRELGEPFAEATRLRDALEQLGAVFQQLEGYSYRRKPHLAALCAPFLDPAHRPSRLLARLNRVVNATGLRGNPLVWLALNVAVPWDFYFAYRLGQLKADIAHHLPVWMDAWIELEALGSLANLATVNPDYTFPEIVAGGPDEGPVFQVQAAGHPLIPDPLKVCNDFTIDRIGEVALFTGSNMSGKSTFLRTIGINLVLAHAGGPVNARSLRTRLFRLCTCIRISDSVTDGISHFYAEVKCLKRLLVELETSQPLPLFYLIDEIFQGTNNRERLIGSRAYIRVLAGRPGVGLISTHDLELVSLAEEAPLVRNYHFQDEVIEDRMAFDYTVRPGPSPTTNALKIMRREGLPVTEIRD
ncbi:MAG: hypothetical protein L0332_33100 [Chloroflexi bacterium]|nr:hypothetical protein [Chloroflexota bacterium]MCI0577367.1 hypothetical protein [Chloroflexota bacterium]MCI0647054.1 hypothetical protein [Chloroflexota bacterium]MCI0731541.1 hypothetical protein [Chloroflexota bacterium]